MLDRVTISNRALGKTGSTAKIASPDEGSHAADTVKAAWDPARLSVLRGTPKHQPKWNFAMGYRETPARIVTADAPLAPGWSAAFPAPAGAIRLCSIESPDCSTHGSWNYAGGEVLLRSTGPLGAWWIFDVPDTAKWDALFEDAFAAFLAFEICDEISGDVGRKDRCWSEFIAKIAAAAKVDAGENPPVIPDESDWITVRGGGPGYPGMCGTIIA